MTMAASRSKGTRPGGLDAGRPASADVDPPRERARRSTGLGIVGLGIVGLDHVQLAMPRGEEALARLFYGGLLGLTEVSKPKELRTRGGCWFVGQGVAIHLGAVRHFRAATRAHPAFLVTDIEQARRALESAGMTIDEDESGLPARRFYVHDPFGNRIEVLDAADGGFTARRVRRRSDRGGG
jgi:catechol 2,3-dioxygenase-like lactoylglutathione lyase family enzyme